MARFAIPQISTGDLLREHGGIVRTWDLLPTSLMQRGALVPDDLVNEMVAARLADPDCARGYILDGFPRTLAQADWLDGYFDQEGGQSRRRHQYSVWTMRSCCKRITGRRVSPAGRIYNIYSAPPHVPGICDVDGSTLEQRNDDTEQVFEQRMKTFSRTDGSGDRALPQQLRFAEVDGRWPLTL